MLRQVPGKKYNMIACGFFQGAMSIAFGLYIDQNNKNGEKPSRESFPLPCLPGRKLTAQTQSLSSSF